MNLKRLVAMNMDKAPRKKKQITEKKIRKNYSIEASNVKGFDVVTITGNPTSNIHFFFLHGGAYVLEASSLHRKMLELLVDLCGGRATFIDYPLAPEHTAETTRQVVLQAYVALTNLYPKDHFCLFGDSAGGGLALALRQIMRDGGMKMLPYKTICCSPWLDVSLSHPDIAKMEKTDIILSQAGLSRAGARYAGKLGIKHSFVSPLFGTMENLGDLFVSVSTNELFLPDCRLLKERINLAEGTTMVLYEAPGLMHDYVLMPWLKESRKTFEAIKVFVLGDG